MMIPHLLPGHPRHGSGFPGAGFLALLTLALTITAARAVEGAGEGHGQERSGAVLTELVDAAMARAGYGAVAAAGDAAARAEERLAGAFLAGAPQVLLSVIEDGPLDDLGQHEYLASVTAPLWHLGERDLARRLAGARADEALELRRALRWELAGQVIDRAAAVFLAERSAELATRRAASARALEAALERFVAVGDRPEAALAQARIERVRAEVGAREATVARRSAEARYALLVGERPLPAHLAPETGEPPAADTIDWRGHPALALAAARVAALAAASEQALLPASRPQLSAGVRREQGDGLAPEIDALLVEFSLPLGRHPRSRVAAARAEQARVEAETALARSRRQLMSRYAHARGALVALAPLIAPLGTALAAADTQLERLERALELGEIDVETLLRARERRHELAREAAILAHEREHLLATLAHLAGELPGDPDADADRDRAPDRAGPSTADPATGPHPVLPGDLR